MKYLFIIYQIDDPYNGTGILITVQGLVHGFSGPVQPQFEISQNSTDFAADIKDGIVTYLATLSVTTDAAHIVLIG